MAEVELVVSPDVIGDEPEVELVRWLAADGASVEAGQAIAELSTAKVVFELQAPTSGILRYSAQEGAVLAATEPIGRILS